MPWKPEWAPELFREARDRARAGARALPPSIPAATRRKVEAHLDELAYNAEHRKPLPKGIRSGLNRTLVRLPADHSLRWELECLVARYWRVHEQGVRVLTYRGDVHLGIWDCFLCIRTALMEGGVKADEAEKLARSTLQVAGYDPPRPGTDFVAWWAEFAGGRPRGPATEATRYFERTWRLFQSGQLERALLGLPVRLSRTGISAMQAKIADRRTTPKTAARFYVALAVKESRGNQRARKSASVSAR